MSSGASSESSFCCVAQKHECFHRLLHKFSFSLPEMLQIKYSADKARHQFDIWINQSGSSSVVQALGRAPAAAGSSDPPTLPRTLSGERTLCSEALRSPQHSSREQPWNSMWVNLMPQEGTCSASVTLVYTTHLILCVHIGKTRQGFMRKSSMNEGQNKCIDYGETFPGSGKIKYYE